MFIIDKIILWYSKNIVNILLAMCCLQDNRTPLDIAVQYNYIDIVHFFIKECNQDISTLKKVCM